MKYKDLIRSDLLSKLVMTAFESPKTNMDIWKFYTETDKHLQFLQSEMQKNVGNEGYITNLLNQDITSEMPKIDLCEKDFENCSYAEAKIFWLTPIEINSIIKWCENQNK